MRPYLTTKFAAGVVSGVTAALFIATAMHTRGVSVAGASVLGVSAAGMQRFAAALGTGEFDGEGDDLEQQRRRPRTAHSFYFTRGVYSDSRGGRWGRPNWATDYPKADLQFVTVLQRLTNLDVYDADNAVAFDDPELRRYPFLYILEVGDIGFRPAEMEGLRNYMLAGGFVFVDDFWGQRDRLVFEEYMRRVLPEYPIVPLSLEHPVFNSFYNIDEVHTLPSISHVQRGIPTECYGCTVGVFGISDETGRLMMLINWNSDIGDAWEWAEQPTYPLARSTYAFQIGVNAITYAMTH